MFQCALSSYGVLGKFGDHHLQEARVALACAFINSTASFVGALQTSFLYYSLIDDTQ